MDVNAAFAKHGQQLRFQLARKHRLDRHVPVPLVGEAFALHRILLGHENRCVVGEIDLRRTERVMVGKRMTDHGQSARFEETKEPLLVTDCTHGVHRGTGESVERARQIRVDQAHRMAGFESHLQLALSPDTVHDHEIDRLEPAQRLAQRPRRHAQSVPVPAFAIDHHDLHVAGEPQVLESVVAQYDVALGATDQDARGGDSIRPGGHRSAGTACQQHRFIPHPLRIAVRPHFPGPSAGGAPVSAAHDPDAQSVPREKLGDGNDQRGLPGTTDAEIADDDDGTADLPGATHAGAIGATPQHRAQPEQPSKRRQQGAEWTRRVPEFRRITHGSREVGGNRRRATAGNGNRQSVRGRSPSGLLGAPRGEGQPVQTGLTGGVHDRDDRLMRGLCIGAEHHLRGVESSSGVHEGAPQGSSVGVVHSMALDVHVPGGINHDGDCRVVACLLLRTRGRELDAQFGAPLERRGHHEEDEQQKDDVNQRREVDLGRIGQRGSKLHRRSPHPPPP